MTAICVIGTELSARTQNVMTLFQVAALHIFAAVALIKVFTDNATPDSITPEASWFSPFDVSSFSALVSGLLLGVFIYWGWESAVNLTEATTDSTRAPGLAAIVSTLVLLVTYLGVSTAVIAYAAIGGVEAFDDDDALFSTLGEGILGGNWDWFVVLAITVSAVSSTQTTIIPASRTTFSMGRAGAFPHQFASIHRRYRTPAFSTIVVAVSGHALVRARQLRVGELPVRDALGAVADDRVLLRPLRARVCDLGYDGSDASDAAIEAAIELTRQFGDRLVIAYADLPPERRRGEEFRAHQEALRELGVETTRKAERRAADAGIEHEVVLVPNAPAEALLGLAEERDARYIVIGSRGEGRIVGAILGTLPHKLPGRSPTPVVVVRALDG